MPIIVPQVDFSPLYRAQQTQEQGLRARYLPQQMALTQKGLDLQQSNLAGDYVSALLDTGLKVGKMLYGVYQDTQIEKAKGMVFSFEQEARQKYNDYLTKGGIQPQPDGTVRMPAEFDSWYQQQVAEFEKTFQGSSEVRVWAKDQLSSVYDTTKTAALGDAMKQYVTDRSKLAQSNLDRAVQQGVASGSMEPVDAALGGMEWLSAQQRQTIRMDAEKDVKLGITQRGVRAMVQQHGYSAGLDAIDNRVLSGELSNEEGASLRQVASGTAQETSAAYSERVSTALESSLRNDPSGNGMLAAVEQVANATPDAYRAQVRAVGEKVAEAKLKAIGEAQWNAFEGKAIKNPGSFTEAELAGYALAVDEPHRATAATYLQNWREWMGLDPKVQAETAQATTSSSLGSQIADWAANPDAAAAPPVTRDQLTAMLSPQDGKPPALTKALRDQLDTDLAKAETTRASSAKDEQTRSLNTNASGLRARLWRAINEGKDPTLAVTEPEIEAAIEPDATSPITPQDHDEILALRERLRGEWETRTKAANPFATRPEIETKAADIVYDPKLDATKDKKPQLAELFAAGGLSPDDYAKWRGRIDPYNDNADQKRAIDSIREAYRLSMANPNLGTVAKKQLAWELFDAEEQMQKTFLIDPEGKTWNAKVQAFLDKRNTDDLSDLIAQSFGTPTMKYTTEEGRAKFQTATTQEALREKDKLPPDLAVRFKKDTEPNVRDLDHDVMARAKLVNKPLGVLTTKVYEDAKVPEGDASGFAGETIYSLKPVKYNTETGQPIANDSMYLVRYDTSGGTYNPVLYHLIAGMDPVTRKTVPQWVEHYRWK